MNALRTQQRYNGCLTTPPLWEGTTVSPFRQMELALRPDPLEDTAAFDQHRLGKLAEAFVFYALKKHPSVSWICDNLQMQQGKRTAGEIDALFYHKGQPVHLEVAYKFYLFDTHEQYDTPLGPWIGPNRKDRLVQKLDKLHRKQFPLLQSELAARYLDHYGLTPGAVEQRHCFKGQLFLPYQQQELDIAPLNPDCIAGFYLAFSELEAFRDAAFFIPQKPDWLITPHRQAQWLPYAAAVPILKAEIDKKRSPMVWVRPNNGALLRCFVVFWPSV
jgi:hypothetical protein